MDLLLFGLDMDVEWKIQTTKRTTGNQNRILPQIKKTTLYDDKQGFQVKRIDL